MLPSAVEAILMSSGTIVVAINAQHSAHAALSRSGTRKPLR
jgi:hypothetical protein